MIFKHKDDLENLLEDIFGYSNFRPGQREIIETILSKRNVLTVMPTGAGKSLCYQLPAIYSKQKTIIVSPLVALIDDQVAALSQLGVQVSKLHSGLSYEENIEQWRSFTSGRSSILYMSPERLMQQRMIEALQRQAVGIFVVDEAHCISKWGAAFRPDYEELAKLKLFFPNAVITAFTATADKQTQADIVDKLTSGDCSVFVKGFDRPNLFLEVWQKQDLKNNLLAFLSDKRNQSGIVYCLSRSETDQIGLLLKSNGFNAISYHAGKTSEYRKNAQDRFMTEDAVVMVSTIAFGMGIDKPDIRYIVHVSLPGSMEAFYQEIGRAGRDGAPAKTLMFFGLQDIVRRQKMIFEGGGNEQYKFLEYKRLQALLGYCRTHACRRIALLSFFDEKVVSCGNCDNCINPPKVEDYTNLAKLLLTAVKETGQNFGSAHIVDVVRGAETTKVKTRSHNQLSAFGLAANQPKEVLQDFVTQLIASNALRVNLEKFGALEIAGDGSRILEGNEKFMAKAFSKYTPSTIKQKSTVVPASFQSNPAILAALKECRLEIARERSVPAFVIFSDKTLIEMAYKMPTTRREFISISGIGQTKLEQFYIPFVNVIKSFANGAMNNEKQLEQAPHRRSEIVENKKQILLNLKGDHYKIENQLSFTPLGSRLSQDFVDDLHGAIHKKRVLNVEAGRMINHGLPHSEEEKSELARRFSHGQTIEDLSLFFQRTVYSIEMRLLELGLIEERTS